MPSSALPFDPADAAFPQSPVISEELIDSDFEKSAAGIGVKIDPASNLTITRDPATGIKLDLAFERLDSGQRRLQNIQTADPNGFQLAPFSNMVLAETPVLETGLFALGIRFYVVPALQAYTVPVHSYPLTAYSACSFTVSAGARGVICESGEFDRTALIPGYTYADNTRLASSIYDQIIAVEHFTAGETLKLTVHNATYVGVNYTIGSLFYRWVKLVDKALWLDP
jgi:hypothetical protein